MRFLQKIDPGILFLIIIFSILLGIWLYRSKDISAMQEANEKAGAATDMKLDSAFFKLSFRGIIIKKEHAKLENGRSGMMRLQIRNLDSSPKKRLNDKFSNSQLVLSDAKLLKIRVSSLFSDTISIGDTFVKNIGTAEFQIKPLNGKETYTRKWRNY